MNKKQLFILWGAAGILTSMVWFPGSWFGNIVEGYPALRADSMEFVVKAVIPLAAFTLLLLYSLRDKAAPVAGTVRLRPHGPRVVSLVSAILILTAGLVLGFIGAYSLIVREERPVSSVNREAGRIDGPDDDFRNFCRREGYKQEVEELTIWLRQEHAATVAILYNKDDAYSHDLYTYVAQRLPDEKITIALSNAFKEGEKSFFRELKALESAQPEAIIFLGSYEERVAFLEMVAQQPQADFWQKRRTRIRWIE